MSYLVRLAVLTTVSFASCGGSSPPAGADADMSQLGDIALPPQPPLAPGCMVYGEPTSTGDGCIFNEACNHTLVCSIVCTTNGSCGCIDPNTPGTPAGPTPPQTSNCANLMDYRPLQFCNCYQ